MVVSLWSQREVLCHLSEAESLCGSFIDVGGKGTTETQPLSFSLFDSSPSLHEVGVPSFLVLLCCQRPELSKTMCPVSLD